MGKGDVYMRRWLSDKKRFADLLNGALFQGKQVILAEKLKRDDTREDVVVRKNNGKSIIVQKYRDIMMTSEEGSKIILLACENQEEIHYAMPVRGMLYDALTYAEQIENLRKENKKNRALHTSAEFLSGMKKTDKLTPLITVVLYYGEDEWNGNTDLYGLLNWEKEQDSPIKKYIPNYHINLIEPAKMKDISCFTTDLQMIFGMLKYRRNKEEMLKYVNRHKDYFSHIDEETYNAAIAVLGSEYKLREATEKLEKKKEGGIDMCQALEELYQDGVNLGIQAMILDNLEEGFGKEKIIGKLIKYFSMKEDEANEYFEKYK